MKNRQQINSKILKFGCLSLVALFLFFILIEKFSPAVEPRQETRDEKVAAQFNQWDGSHDNLTKAIKRSMNDPDSYQHVETVYWDMDTCLIISVTYRGKNAFGGIIIQNTEVRADLDGNIIEIFE